MAALLQTHKLTKDFGNNKGVFDLDIEIKPGEIVGFVGPNGAGKSTTINILAGNNTPDRGKITLFGTPVTPNNIYKLMPRMGVLFSESTLELGLTPEQAFKQSLSLLGKPGDDADWREMSKLLELNLHKPIKQLSLGNKKKVGIVLTLLHKPELIIMDEPTSSLDPLVQSKFASLLKQATHDGAAVLLSSHDLSEVQHVCDRVIMIREGKLIIDRPVRELLQSSARQFIIHHAKPELLNVLSKAGFERDGTSSGFSTVIMTHEYRQLIELLTKHDMYDFYVQSPSLESMFAEYYND